MFCQVSDGSDESSATVLAGIGSQVETAVSGSDELTHS